MFENNRDVIVHTLLNNTKNNNVFSMACLGGVEEFAFVVSVTKSGIRSRGDTLAKICLWPGKDPLAEAPATLGTSRNQKGRVLQPRLTAL